MNLIIIGKMGFAVLGIAVASAGGIFLHQWFTSETVEIYGFISASTSTTDVKMNCQIDLEKFNCKIEEVTKLTDESKNHVLLTSFTGSANSKLIEAKETLDATKFYKISMSQDVFDNKAKEWSTKPITVIYESTILGTMSAMFAVKNGAVIQGSPTTTLTLGSSYIKSFIGQASGKIQSTADYKCSWNATLEHASLKPCSIYPFVENDSDAGQNDNTQQFLELTFSQIKKSQSTKQEIKENHYYLIQFTNPTADSKKLSEFNFEEIIYAKNPSDTDDKKVTFKKLSAAAAAEGQLLILQKHKDA